MNRLNDFLSKVEARLRAIPGPLPYVVPEHGGPEDQCVVTGGDYAPVACIPRTRVYGEAEALGALFAHAPTDEAALVKMVRQMESTAQGLAETYVSPTGYDQDGSMERRDIGERLLEELEALVPEEA